MSITVRASAYRFPVAGNARNATNMFANVVTDTNVSPRALEILNTLAMNNNVGLTRDAFVYQTLLSNALVSDCEFDAPDEVDDDDEDEHLRPCVILIDTSKLRYYDIRREYMRREMHGSVAGNDEFLCQSFYQPFYVSDVGILDPDDGEFGSGWDRMVCARPGRAREYIVSFKPVPYGPLFDLEFEKRDDGALIFRSLTSQPGLDEQLDDFDYYPPCVFSPDASTAARVRQAIEYFVRHMFEDEDESETAFDTIRRRMVIAGNFNEVFGFAETARTPMDMCALLLMLARAVFMRDARLACVFIPKKSVDPIGDIHVF